MDLPQFRIVLRGYDQEQVVAALKELQTSLGVARRAAADRTIELSRVTDAKAKVDAQLQEVRARLTAPQQAPVVDAPSPAVPERPSRGFDELGARVSSILSLAEAEAEQLRSTAADEARAVRQEAAEAAEAVRTESEQYAARVHERTDLEVSRMTSAATATADAIVSQANEHAHGQRTESESALAAERAQHEAWVVETRSGADRAVAEAREQAEQVRGQTHQQLQDAIRRRDAVHAQLTEVNQLLAVLEDALADAGRLPEPTPISHG